MTLFAINVEHKEAKALEKQGAHKVVVKYLIDRIDGAQKFFLRHYTVEASGYTPLDRHPYEHQVYILEGRGLARVGDQEMEVKPGDAVFVPSNTVHQFLTAGTNPLTFLCIKGAEELYGEV